MRLARFSNFPKVSYLVLEELGCGPRFNLFENLKFYFPTSFYRLMNLGVSKTKAGKIALYPASPLYPFPILEEWKVNGFSLKKKKKPR